MALAAYSPGGSSLYTDVNFLPAASNAGQFASNYGLGTYDEIALGKLLTGKKAGCEVSISGLYENVNGSSTPKDFETMMQLMYLRFMEPRFDTLAHKVIIERNHIYAKQIAGQPQTLMRDSLSLISANYSPRVQLFNDAYVDRLTLDRIEKAYRDRICDASDFTFFIVGNVDKDTARVMAQKYIGSLPSLYRNEKWVDRQVRAPKGKVEKNIEIPLEVPKSTVIVLFNREMKYTLKEAYTINILGNILTNRYTKTIREEQGGTYGVGVSGSASREPYNNYNMYTGIPVILSDRSVELEDDSLYTCWVGSNFQEEGENAGKWLADYLKQQGMEDTVNIVALQGTLGSTAQIGRTKGFEAVCRQHPEWNLLESRPADFTQAKGRLEGEDRRAGHSRRGAFDQGIFFACMKI